MRTSKLCLTFQLFKQNASEVTLGVLSSHLKTVIWKSYVCMLYMQKTMGSLLPLHKIFTNSCVGGQREALRPWQRS